MPEPGQESDAPPFVARAEELAYILDEITRGETDPDRPCGVVLVGSAGVGKTRLVDEVARTRGSDTARIVGTRASGLQPFGAVAHLAPGRSPRDFDDVGAWYGAVAGTLRGSHRQRPLLVVDDAHLLDDASAALVLHLVLTATASVVATVRHGEACPDAVVALWRDGHSRRVDLQPLSDIEAETLITTVLDGHVGARTVHRLIELCGGNPLFINEVLVTARASGALRRHQGVWRWSGEVPHVPRLIDAVADRMGDLDPVTWSAIATVALGEPLPITVAEQIVPADVLTRIETLGLIDVDGPPDALACSSAHPLYGEVAVDRVGHLERRRIVGALADTMAGLGPDDDLRLLVTRHRVEAGFDVPAPELTDAATIAGRAFDNTLAAELATAAIAAGDVTSASVVLARALLGLGRAEEAEAVLADVEDAVHATGDIELARAHLQVRFDAAYLHLGRSELVAGVLDRFVEAPRDGGPAQDRRDIADAYRAVMAVHGGHFARVLALAEPVWKRPDAPERARLHALGAAGEALAYQGRTRTARIVQDAMRAVAATGGRAVRNGSMLADMQQVLCLSMEGRVDLSVEIMEASEAFMRTSPDAQSRGLVSAVLGAVYLGQGRPASARRPLLDALDAYRSFDPAGSGGWAAAMLAQAEALLGDVDAAEEAIALSRQRRVNLAGIRSAFDVVAADALTAMARGSTSQAVTILLDAVDAFDEASMFKVRALHLAVTFGADPKRLLAPLQALAATMEADLAGMYAAHVWALVNGDGRALEVVTERFADYGLYLEAAETAAEASARYRAEALRGAAARTAARSRTLQLRCEGAMTPLLATLEAPVALSRREREVASLAAKGCSNKDIAEQLSVSVRTVESHLYKVFAKVGVDHRGDLATHLGFAADPTTGDRKG